MQFHKSATRMLPAALASVLCCGSALADHGEGEWYLSPMVSFVDDATDRGADDQFAGGQLGFGYGISDVWAIEFNAWAANLDDRYLGNDQQIRGLGIDWLREFKINDTFAPYGLFGVGYQSSEPAITADREDFVGTLGIGLMTTVNDDGVAFRTEARLRAALGSPNLNDMYYSAGLRVPLGERTPPPPPDADGDGVSDSNDRCPNTPAGTRVGPDGCEVDSDKDGVVDSKDQCPNTPRGAEVDANGCKLKDSDGDGVPDKRDACPKTPAGARVDSKGCEIDSDKDGVVNSKDRCPNTKAGVAVDVYGCEIKDRIELPGVQFELNSARLVRESTRVLDDAAETLKRNPDINVQVAGHTDSSGAASYNLSLSQKRADAVAAYLQSKGVAAARMTTKGYGETEPTADNTTKEGRAQNRRVTLRVVNVD
ncbi:MAG: OmpA family protein [Pseudomonadota bacterium]